MNDYYDKLLEKYPFLTVIDYNGTIYCGVISVINTHQLSMYVISDIMTDDVLQKFLELCEKWWVFSDRKNLSLFLKKELAPFKKFLKFFTKNQIKEIRGRIPPSYTKNKKKIISFKK